MVYYNSLIHLEENGTHKNIDQHYDKIWKCFIYLMFFCLIFYKNVG